MHHINNRIEIHVRDLNRPMWSIPFNRFNDAWRWNNGKNYAEAEEWQSRLTTWLHSERGNPGKFPKYIYGIQMISMRKLSR